MPGALYDVCGEFPHLGISMAACVLALVSTYAHRHRKDPRVRWGWVVPSVATGTAMVLWSVAAVESRSLCRYVESGTGKTTTGVATFEGTGKAEVLRVDVMRFSLAQGLRPGLVGPLDADLRGVLRGKCVVVAHRGHEIGRITRCPADVEAPAASAPP